MNNQSGNIYIIEATSDYKKIHKSLIENPNIDCLTLGIYTKLVVLGLKWKLNINGLSKYLNISDTKIRQSIKLLEQEGYIVRIPQRDERGRLQGWNYQIYPIPVNEQNRSHAGIKTSPCTLKTDNTVNRQHGEPTTRITDKAENGEDINNILNQSIDLNNNKDLNKENKHSSNKKLSFDVREDLSYVEQKYIEIWKEWLDYKDEIRKQYKTQRGAITQYNSLIKYANDNPTLANAIVKTSIEHSWDGLFALNEKQIDLFLSPKSPYGIIDQQEDDGNLVINGQRYR